MKLVLESGDSWEQCRILTVFLTAIDTMAQGRREAGHHLLNELSTTLEHMECDALLALSHCLHQAQEHGWLDALASRRGHLTGGGVAPWEIALCVDAGAAHAASARGQLGTAESCMGMHLVARLEHAQRRDSTDDDRCLVLAAGAWAACVKVLAERPRRRQLQQLPPAAIDVLYRWDASEQEDKPIAA
jgi:hypothetical protein